jgi:uncharacterized protein (DUF1697 family)
MNVGGHRLENEDLCVLFEAMGLTRVQAFLASGNVVFEVAAGAVLERADLEEGLESELGYQVPTFLRTEAEVRAIVERDVLVEERKTSAGKLQVALLARLPSAAVRAAVLGLESEHDRLAVHGRELYWLPSGGLLQSELDMGWIEKKLGPMTVRTIRTLERLVARLLSG